MEKIDSSGALHNPKGQQTVVIKVGTSSLIRASTKSLNLSSLASLVETCRDLHNLGFNVIVVSSGAVAVGCQRLGLSTRPRELAKKQALAAIGQIHLMRYYDDLFTALGLVLLTLDNLATRSQYINARNTFHELLRYGTIPIINENDTVAVAQLRFGDNDTLSAQVATLVEADWLFLLTDVDALYTGNPSTDPTATPVHEVDDVHDLAVDTAEAGTQWGTGGMATKLTAAGIATAAGCRMVICHFNNPSVIVDIIGGESDVGTVFHPISDPLKGRKRWILSVPSKGEIWVDDGAARAIKKHASLFAAGITKVVGEFQHQDAVKLCDAQGRELAQGLTNYSNVEVEAAKGLSSAKFLEKLGYQGQEEVVHRASICLLVKREQGRSMRRTPSRGSMTSLASSRAPSPAGPESGYEDSPSHSPAPVARGQSPGRSRTPPLPPTTGQQESGAGEGQEGPALSEDDIVTRLAHLRQRAGLGASGPSDDWDSQMAYAMHAELQGSMHAKPVASDQDVDEGGWLPK
ncbi:Glutamate 5-kinase [Auxenochlorella protothecoides]|uniref:Glutamate 5-kinase n=1 Tax=Auxenochlorella protothecoides TaxID=3075 RepID=A0A087SR43_AUXPR|nr:Glutamate 5-kinase [Auxenochlorella protothecoides]KFM28197.1 Glutamate 5-kinase [Auxenochlorella protothecoides]